MTDKRPNSTYETERKKRVTIWLDKDVIEHFRAQGMGWQPRINDALRRAAGLDIRKGSGTS